ncbi:MAG: hypothetical protein ACE5IR_18790 [bacterium]
MNWRLFYSILTLMIVQGLFLSNELSAQQKGDMNFKPAVENPAYEKGKGPVVLIDEAHHNFHTSTGRYRAFADLLRRDGYVVRGIASKFTRETLRDADILVIANSLSEYNVGNWTLPTPSAFDKAEIDAVHSWY